MNDDLILAGKSYSSRLLVGTGKYKDMAQTRQVIEASGADIVTVALRRMDLGATGEGSIQDALDPKRYTYLPNTAGCANASEAVRTLRLARELGGWSLVKLEIIEEHNMLYPNIPETLAAAEILVKEGFSVMAYTTDDAKVAKQLEEMGCAAIMPLAAPIGSGLGILKPDNIQTIVQQSRVPVLVDAGIGTASDACIAMELGCDAVLLNTALAAARNPLQMAYAMKAAVEAGRLSYLAGRMPKRENASPSSPTQGILPQ